MPQLRAAAAEFWRALTDTFVRHSVLIFLTLSLLFLALYGAVYHNGPIMTEEPPAQVVTVYNPLQPILIFAFYGGVALLFGLLVWVAVPALVISFVVSLVKLAKRR